MKESKIPTCPFCGRPIAKPTYLPIGFSDLEAGICECGSVYVCDVTGHNRGAAFVEALLIACAGDWDLAWDLSPDEDYKEIWVEVELKWTIKSVDEWHGEYDPATGNLIGFDTEHHEDFDIDSKVKDYEKFKPKGRSWWEIGLQIFLQVLVILILNLEF